MSSTKIVGPFWEANAKVIELADPIKKPALRALFVENTTRGAEVGRSPKTLLMLARVQKVTVRSMKLGGDPYVWTNGPAPGLISEEKLGNLVRNGELALLLVEADDRRNQYTCLAGDIRLDQLQPQENAQTRLFQHLHLEQADLDLDDRSGAASLAGALTVHGSGLSIYGQATLPWQTEPVAAPFQLTERLPGPGARVTIEVERLTDKEREDLIQVWRALGRCVNPGNPQYDRADSAPAAPHWVTLEIANPEDVPRLYWEWDPSAATDPELHFQGDQFKLLLSDQQPYDQEFPPTSLAHIVLDDIKLKGQGNGLHLEIQSIAPDAGTEPGTLQYTYTGEGDAPEETLKLSEVEVAYDPIQTPQFLRNSQDLPVPEWPGAVPVEPAILWGFAPLEDGWAQLPVPNLAEQIYLDAGLEQFEQAPTEAPPALLQGAVAFGNDSPKTIAAHPEEQPWNLTLIDAQKVTGRWELVPEPSKGYRLASVALFIAAPRLAVNGLFWLSTGKPSAADALPDLEDWTAGLESISLRTVDSTRDLFPPLVTVTLGGQDQAGPIHLSLRQEKEGEKCCGVSALLGAWSLAYQVDQDLFEEMRSKKVLPDDAFSRRLPWVWRRHPTLPMVQALPLTQSQSPPNYPSPSRQLVPYQLTSGQDKVLALFQGSGATAWAKLSSRAEPAEDWTSRPDLPLVSLSLPGVVLDPSLEGAGLGKDETTQLPRQYRFDLPYTDEINALAQLPEVVADPEKVSPLPDSPPPEPPPPLTRETFGEHWARLSEQASLAAADAVEAFEKDGQTAVRHLVEPFDWPVQPTLDLDAYPGTLSLADDTDSLALSGERALRGISGCFAADGTDGQIRIAGETEENPFLIEAGGMAAHRGEDGMYRDQRGLWRGATVPPKPAVLITTPVRLQHKEAGQTVHYDLTSALAPFELVLGDPDNVHWQIWFRDLPVRREDGTFDRGQVRSDRAQDVNDPGALSREHDYLAGYEWRLGAGATSSAPLPLFGLDYYPLTLEKMVFDKEEIQSIELVGRLQLPLADQRELEDLGNAVRLTFRYDAGKKQLDLERIALESVEGVSAEGEWPLALERGEDSGAPRLVWDQIKLVTGKIQVGGVRLHFFLFGVEWTHLLGTLEFPQAGGPQTYTLPTSTSLGLQPHELGLTLDPVDGKHQLSVTLDIRLGKQDTDAAAPRFQATVKYDLLGEGAGTATLESALLFGDLELREGEGNISIGERAMQFDFKLLQKPDLQLLPGMGLQAGKDAPGFAALTFTATAKPNSVPDLELTSAFMEALLFCRWCEALQDHTGDDATETQVFGSSAGDLAVGYTTQLQAGSWQESLLLNGFLEVKNLISWPTELIHPATEPAEPTRLVLPAVPEDGKLRHTRHTIRVLFNQHQVPTENLVLSPSDGLFFNLHQDQPWQFLAVVEHQLVDVEPVDGWETFATSNDRRWTTLQEVRFVSPSKFQDFLESNRHDGKAGQGPDLDYGYLAGGLPDLLTVALDELPETTLIVEASAPHWVHRQPLTAARMTTLQFLPNGSQHAILSGPGDYAPSDPQDPKWLLLPMPFLGRLQDAGEDFPPKNGGVNALQVDPILLLHRDEVASAPDLAWTLTHWRKDDTPSAAMIVSGFDTALGRTWARLDPTSLEENWFRLQNPIPEPQPTVTHSVVAALPDTPARLSRATALRRAFDAFRPAYPPAIPAGIKWPAVEVGDAVVWRRDSLMVLQGIRVAGDADTLPRKLLRDILDGEPADWKDTQANNSFEEDPSLFGTFEVGGQRVFGTDSNDPDIHSHYNASGAMNWSNYVYTGRMYITNANDSDKNNVGAIGVTFFSHYPENQDRYYKLRGKVGDKFRIFQHPYQEDNGKGGKVKSGDKVGGEVIPSKVEVKEDTWYRFHIEVEVEDKGSETTIIRAKIWQEWEEEPEFQMVAHDRSRKRIKSGTVGVWAHRLGRKYFDDLKVEPLEVPRPPDGWHITAAQLRGIDGTNDIDSSDAPQRHAAATLMPAQLTIDDQDNPRPLSFAVSPYLGLGFRRADEDVDLEPQLASVELLCRDRASGLLCPAASSFWELQDGVDIVQFQTWARETHRRLCPDSPIAVLRFRQINRLRDDARESVAVLTTTYDFAVVPDLDLPATLARRVFHLRAAAGQLRFREGQFGGSEMPEEIVPFEIAPPQITGVQPLYLTERPAAVSPGAWPWGLSALRLSVQYTPGKVGVIGRLAKWSNAPDQNDKSLTLWWQAPQYSVQFRSALTADRPAWGLPQHFRARAIKSLLPVLPALPLPILDFTDQGQSGWQPVLPGALRYLISGARAGVLFAIRNQILRQSGLQGGQKGQAGKGMISGSVPVQHRVPRPVPLPPNTNGNREKGLQPWASYFEPGRNVLANSSPADEAFFASYTGGDGTVVPAKGLQMTLREPARGAVTIAWNGELVFEIRAESDDATDAIDIPNWVEIKVTDGDQTFVCDKLQAIPEELGRYRCVFQSAEVARQLLEGKVAGQIVTANAYVGHDTATDGFRQTLSFPLRVVDEARPPLPLAPYFLHFEDPEYNRRLSSPAAIASGTFKDDELHTVTLATDRREYNPDSRLALRYDWDDEIVDDRSATLAFSRIDKNGIETPLTVRSPADNLVQSLVPGKLIQISLMDLDLGGEPVRWEPGDTLQLKLAYPSAQQPDLEIYLEVRIVETPVIPAPEVAYALLHAQEVDGRRQVECVRFAWSPEATRIELVCPDDLKTEVVRRRAVFHWVHSVRPGRSSKHAIQKITQTGSTHFPLTSIIDSPPPAPSG